MPVGSGFGVMVKGGTPSAMTTVAVAVTMEVAWLSCAGGTDTCVATLWAPMFSAAAAAP